ncbi:unnamed protein product [Clonostachys rosea]|uniref:Uncharacterized protein n=1 Tax=Bionectria ochroleuca TaxID=29856 RepID=A0ABY6U7Q2_BIOOC|nr:unnamed protein product [Clonostachys rosea]
MARKQRRRVAMAPSSSLQFPGLCLVDDPNGEFLSWECSIPSRCTESDPFFGFFLIQLGHSVFYELLFS